MRITLDHSIFIPYVRTTEQLANTLTKVAFFAESSCSAVSSHLSGANSSACKFHRSAHVVSQCFLLVGGPA